MIRLKELRTSSGVTQMELSKLLKCSNNTISRYELGEREPDFATISALADFFDVSTDYLLGRTNIPDPPNKEKAPISNEDLKIAFFGNPNEDDALLEDVRNYAQFVKERKQSQVKKDENAK